MKIIKTILHKNNCAILKTTKWAAAFILLFTLSITNKAYCQEEGPDTSIHETANFENLDSTQSIAFVSDYGVVEINEGDEITVNVNQVLNIEQLKVAKKYTITLTYQNNLGYDVILEKATPSCSCIEFNVPGTIIHPGNQVSIPVVIFPTTPGVKVVVVKVPIRKKLTGIVTDATPFKLTYSAIPN